MTNKELETRYKQMKSAWKNLVNANIELSDENKVLKEEIECLNNIINKAREYIMTELITEWDIKNNGYVSGSDLPVDAITSILKILDEEVNIDKIYELRGGVLCNCGQEKDQ